MDSRKVLFSDKILKSLDSPNGLSGGDLRLEGMRDMMAPQVSESGAAQRLFVAKDDRTVRLHLKF